MYKLQKTIEDWERSRKATTTFLRSSAEELKASHKRNAEKEHACATTSLVADTDVMYKLRKAIENWEKSRQRTTAFLRRTAEELMSSHKRNAETEVDVATTSFLAGGIGFTGLVLAPISGGLSLAAVGISSFMALGAYVCNSETNKENENKKQDVQRKVRQIIDEDEKAFEKVKHVEKIFIFFEEKLDEMEIHDVLLRIERTEILNLKASVENIRKVRKIGEAIKSVFFPLDEYNLWIETDNLHRKVEAASRMENLADSLEEDMNKVIAELKVKYDHIEKLHIQLCKLYKDHRIDVIYDFLQLIKQQFELDTVLC